ncbi:MAG TPA: DinB family protein [Abditibacterium sp.]|jgi:uncharacterized damage-inducible protein DinB
MTPYIRTNYYASGVRGNARLFEFLLRDLDENDARWDKKVDPARFTLREIVAHLVDYDTICRERFERMIREDNPFSPEWDEGKAAIHYGTRHPKHQLESLLLSRREFGDWLEGLSQEEWERRGTRLKIGEFSVEYGVSLMLAHDAYHLIQIVAWLEAP